MKICPSTYRSPKSGYLFSCDRDEGHDGPHRGEDYDDEHDCFREAEWTGSESRAGEEGR